MYHKRQIIKWIGNAILCLAMTLPLSAGLLSAGESDSLDKLIQYYSAKASVEKEYGMLGDYQANTDMGHFLKDQKTKLATVLKANGKALEIEAVNKAALAYYRDCSKGQADVPALGKADHERYIDVRTGHLYIKRDDGNYNEYTRKGAFFKTVPANLPLLLSGKYVHPVSSASYLLYSKKRHLPDSQFKILPAKAPHPKGWSLESALVDLNRSQKGFQQATTDFD